MNLVRLGEVSPNGPERAVESVRPSSRAVVTRRAGVASKRGEACAEAWVQT